MSDHLNLSLKLVGASAVVELLNHPVPDWQKLVKIFPEALIPATFEIID